MSDGHFRDSIKLPPQPAAKGIGRDETTSPGGSPSRGPLAVHAPLPLPPLLAVLPRPPSAAAASIGKAAAGGKLDGQWMQDAWQSVKGMERKWQRLRDARGDAVHLALHQANAVISEAKGHAEMLDSENAGADRSSFAPSGLPGTVSASPMHSGAPQPRRRRRGGGGENGPISGSMGAEYDERGSMEWQCQVSRPGRVVPHQATITATAQGLLLQWNHIEALIGKDSLAQAFLTGKHLIAPCNILAVTSEGHGWADSALGSGRDQGGQADTLCVHVLTTPCPINSPEGQSDYNIYRLFAFEGASPREALQRCRHAIKAMADASPSLSGRRMSAASSASTLAQPASCDSGAGGAPSEAWKVYFIVNPVSGHRLGEAYWNKIHPLFTLAGVEYDFTLTSYCGHATSIVGPQGWLDLDKYHFLVCIGGDGTVSEVVNALMQRADGPEQLKRLVLATVAAGSECALAKMISFVEPIAAAWTILKGHKERQIDLLRITQNNKCVYSMCGVGWGIAGKLAEDSESLRALYGPARYLVSGLKNFVSLKGCEGTLEIEAVTQTRAHCEHTFAGDCDVCHSTLPHPEEQSHTVIWEGPFVCVALLKSEKALVPYVHCNDGYVDVLAVPDVGRIELLRRSSKILMPDLMGHHLASPAGHDSSAQHVREQDRDFWYTKARSVLIKPQHKSDKFNVDGEVLDGDEMKIEVMKGALRMLVAFHHTPPLPASTPESNAQLSQGASSGVGIGGGAQSLFEGLISGTALPSGLGF